ncbi:MAG: hypothetical protein EBU70_14180 [Actinobacteria bacterium]|nr:hypothetical protein [Actinomycetota bacterium]
MDRGDLPYSNDLPVPGVPSSPQWYSRAAVDEFLAAADAERRRLEATIADARARLARATSAAGLQQTVVEMMLDAQREVADIRRAAELASAGILAPIPQSVQPAASSASIASSYVDSVPSVAGLSTDGGGRTAPPSFVDPLGGRPRTDRDDVAFFEYLRDELHRDGPLGPMQP